MGSKLFSFVTQHAYAEMDRQNFDSQNNASIASRGKKNWISARHSERYSIKGLQWALPINPTFYHKSAPEKIS